MGFAPTVFGARAAFAVAGVGAVPLCESSCETSSAPTSRVVVDPCAIAAGAAGFVRGAPSPELGCDERLEEPAALGRGRALPPLELEEGEAEDWRLSPGFDAGLSALALTPTRRSDESELPWFDA